METILIIFALSIFIGLEIIYRLKWRDYKKSQQAYNRFVLEMFEKQGVVNQEAINNFRLTNTKLSEIDRRVLNAGTKIIELDSLLAFDKEKIN